MQVWTWYLTVPVLIWVAGFTLVYRLRHKQPPGNPDESLLECARRSLKDVEAQIWLLTNVLWWYLLPPTLSLMTFFVHTNWQLSGNWWLTSILAIENVHGADHDIWAVHSDRAYIEEVRER